MDLATVIVPLVYLLLALRWCARLVAWDAHDNAIIYARGDQKAARYGVHAVQRVESRLVFLIAFAASSAVLVVVASTWWGVLVAHVAAFGLASSASLWGDWYFQRTISWCFSVPFPDPDERAESDGGDPRAWPKPFYGKGHWRGREHQRKGAMVVGVVSLVGYVIGCIVEKGWVV